MAAAAVWARARNRAGAGRELGECAPPSPPALPAVDTAPNEADVEARCAQLARSAGPLRRVLATLAARFEAVRGWQGLGYVRLGDYARERLGLSARELQDLARVDAALHSLPRVEAALVAGELAWTKVRLIARTARPDEEAQWLAFARRVPVRQLERHVRAVDAGSVEAGAADPDPSLEGRRQGVSALVPNEIHAKWQIGWRLARRVSGEALRVDRAAEYICAEVLSAMPLAPAEEDDAPPAPQGMGSGERRAARWDQRGNARRARQEERLRALFRRVTTEPNGYEGEGGQELPELLQPLVAGVDRATPRDLDARLRRAVALEQRREADLGPLLLHVLQSRLYRLHGFANLPDYARARLGLSSGKAWALVRLERSRKSCPAVLDAYREGVLSWVQSQALLGIVPRAPHHHGAWVAWAQRVTVRRLRDDVDRALLLAERDPEHFARTGGVPQAPRLSENSGVQTRAQHTEPGETPAPEPRPQWAPPGMGRVFFTAPAEVARLFRATLCSVRRRLGGGDGDALDAMLEHCFEAWGIRDPKQERERKRRYRIFERDGWRCAVPGCTSYRDLHAHHIQPRSRGGSDEDENQITLCAWHHLRAVHGTGVVRIAPGGRRFELPLGVYDREEVRVEG